MSRDKLSNDISVDNLADIFLDKQIGEVMDAQRQSQRNIKALIIRIKATEKKFRKARAQRTKDRLLITMAVEQSQLVYEQARLEGMIAIKESLDDFRSIPF